MEFTLRTFIAASPLEVYRAWLDGEQHGAITGAAATGEGEIGSLFTAWDGYISGENLELEPDEKIIQSWRTTEFKEDDGDSRVEINLKASEGGCELILTHTNIPDGQPDYEQGWRDHYFKPMQEYFSD